MTAVMRAALDRLNESIITNSSIRFSFTGGQVGWTMKMSRPRTSSSMRQEISPSGKLPRVTRPSESPRWRAILSASGRLARPLKTFSLLPLSMRARPEADVRGDEGHYQGGRGERQPVGWSGGQVQDREVAPRIGPGRVQPQPAPLG